ncbi:MAG: tRNA lysidine(34) synthetase TilS [Acidobacteria bacterium]|nr:tRNA lysidine(34) synthetase TilS [Acidobacteriota bacterium]
MATLLDRIARTIEEHQLIGTGDRVVAAVSGGSDSVALALVLQELARARAFTLAGLAHLNHQLRGVAAEEDERFCRELADRLGVPIEVGRIDVGARAFEMRRPVEDAARIVRYEFLEAARKRLGGDVVAVGHTRDDQAETFLLKLIRGAGPRGLAGIYPRRDAIVRPLIAVTRSELRDYLNAHGVPYREDETNRDLKYLRNRVRHRLVPYLHDQFSPAIVDVLAREAKVAREDADYLKRAAEEVQGSVVGTGAEGTTVDVDALLSLHPAVQRRVILNVLTMGSGGRFVGFEHVEEVLRMLRRPFSCLITLDLPGQRATRSGDVIILTRREPGTPADTLKVNFFRYPLSIPGEVEVPEAGWAISAEPSTGPAEIDVASGRGSRAIVRAERLARPLAVRNRRPGDRFRPLGLAGHKKLQDFFVDRKIARADRDRVPVVVDAEDRIVWVVGGTIADDFRVTGATEGVIILKAKRLASKTSG